MSWVRLDDGFHDHRKTISVSLEAIGLYTLGLTWASRHESDGRLPKAIVMHLARANTCALADELMRAGLWRDGDDGYVIHDFLDYNPSAKSRNRKKKEARERMRSFRSGSPVVRANSRDAFAPVLRGRDGTGTGVLVPASGGSAEGGFDRFWAAYPRRVGKAAARKAWAKVAPDAALLERILAAVAVQAQSAQWQRDGGEYIPHPTTWLNGARWEDEVTPAGTVVPHTKAAERSAASRAAVEAFSRGTTQAAPRDVTPLRVVEGGGT